MKGEIKMNNSKEIQTNNSDNLINFLINLVITYGRITEETKNTLKLTFGRYPKTIINSIFKKTLEEKYLSKVMNETGNTYTFPVNQYTNLTYKEYEYKNRLFIRIEDKQKNIFWIEVGEVNWTINLRKNLLSLEKDTFTFFPLINQSISKEEFITNFFFEDLLQSLRKDTKIKILTKIKERSKEIKEIVSAMNSKNNNSEIEKTHNNDQKVQSLKEEANEELTENSPINQEIDNSNLNITTTEEKNDESFSLAEQNNNLFLELDKNQFKFSILSFDEAEKLENNEKAQNSMFAKLTFFSSFSGNMFEKLAFYYHYDNKINPSGNGGQYWTSTTSAQNSVHSKYNKQEIIKVIAKTVSFEGELPIFNQNKRKYQNFQIFSVNDTSIGTRPIIEFKNTAFLKNVKINPDGISINLGYQPQDNISHDLQEKLEGAYQNIKKHFYLNQDIKKYSYPCNIKNRKIKDKKLIEFEYKNRKFVRLELPALDENFIEHYYPDGILKNPNEIEKSTGIYNIAWVEVKPLRWIILDNKTLLAEKIFFAGRPYHTDKNDQEITFEKSSLFSWMNEILVEELFSKKTSIVLDEEKKERENDTSPKKRIKVKKTFQFENTNSPIIEQDTTHSIQNNILDYEEETKEVQEDVDNTYLDTTAIEEENIEDFSNIDIEEPPKRENQSLDKNYVDTQEKEEIKSETNDYLSLVEQNNNLFLELDKNQFAFSILSANEARNLKENKKVQNKMFAEFTLFSALNSELLLNWLDNPSYGAYWTSTPYVSYGVKKGRYVVNYESGYYEFDIFDDDTTFIGTRPIIKFKNTSFLKNTKVNSDGISIDLGYRPQDNIPYDLQQKLENAYQKYQEHHYLNQNPKKYSYPSPSHNKKKEKLIEFEYENRKFIRLELSELNENFIERYYPDGILKNTNGVKKETEVYYISWIEIKPLRWIILDNKTLLAEKIFFAGRPYHNGENNKEVKVEESSLFSWMNNSLVEELFSKKTPIILDKEKKKIESDSSPKQRAKEKTKKQEKFEPKNNDSSINIQNKTNLAQNNTLDYEEKSLLVPYEIENNSQEENIEESPKKENQSLDKNHDSNQKEFKEKQEEINNTYLDNATIKEKITKEECQKILTLIKTPIFNQLRKQFSEKEAVIISLMFGYIDGKYFSKEAIAKFLDIETEEVTQIAKKVLLSYKKYLNQLIDNAIELIEKPVKQIEIPSKVKKQN